MTIAHTRLLGSGLTAALIAGTLLVTPPTAQAAPVFTQISVHPTVSTSAGGDCTFTSPAPVAPPDSDLVENGAPVTTTATANRSYVANGDVTDTVSAASTITASSRVTTSGGLPQSISTSFTGVVQATASKPTSTCAANTSADVKVNFEFTIAQPMWLTWATTHKGSPAYAEAWIYDNNGDPYEDHYGYGLDGASSGTYYLAPGTYGGYIQGLVQRRSSSTASVQASGSASMTFAPVGSASKAPSGKASKFVALPSARACATHNATATLTAKKKLIKQIDKVTFAVNGKKAATLKGKKVKKGKAVVLPLADSAAADITATVLLDNGKKKTVSASYLACTS